MKHPCLCAQAEMVHWQALEVANRAREAAIYTLTIRCRCFPLNDLQMLILCYDLVSFFFLLLPAGFRAAAATAATAADIPATHLCIVSAGRPGAASHGWSAALLRSAACQPAHHHEVIKTYQQTGKNLNCLFTFPFLTQVGVHWLFLSPVQISHCLQACPSLVPPLSSKGKASCYICLVGPSELNWVSEVLGNRKWLNLRIGLSAPLMTSQRAACFGTHFQKSAAHRKDLMMFVRKDH